MPTLSSIRKSVPARLLENGQTRPKVLASALLLSCALGSLATAQVIGEKKVKKIPIKWAQHESEHYQISYEDQAIPKSTVLRISGELEDILEQYIRIFRVRPKKKEPLLVKFLDSQNTYEQEGGDPSHPGYYNPGSRYLVLKQMPFHYLIPVCYHEAAHQYLHLYVGYRPIPTWFNEGMAMYFEGMQRSPGAGKRPLDPKRIKNRKLRMVKDAVFTRSHIPLETLIDATHQQFHEKEKENLYYAESFSVVYFLMQKMRGKPLAYAKALRQTKDEAKAVEAANTKLFGKKRKNLKKIELAWKNYLARVQIDKE